MNHQDHHDDRKQGKGWRGGTGPAGSCRHECDKHWHTFDNETQIRGYYDGLLRVRRVHTVPHMGNWKKFVVSGQRVCVSHAE